MKMYPPISVKASEKEAIREAAKEQGMSVSEYVRVKLRAAVKDGLDLSEINLEETVKIQFEIEDAMFKAISRASRKGGLSNQHFVRLALLQGVKKDQQTRSTGNPSDDTGAARGEEGCPG